MKIAIRTKYVYTMIVIILSILFFGGTALTEEVTIVKSGSCGTGVSYQLDSVGTLTISGEGAMDNYTLDSMPWYKERRSILSVVIEDGVTCIGDYAFYRHTSLSDLTLNKDLESIGNYAFYQCYDLADFTFPAGLKNIGDYAFTSCTLLTCVNLYDGIESIGKEAFQNCIYIEEVSIANSLRSIGKYAFNKCSHLLTATLPQCVMSGAQVAGEEGTVSFSFPTTVQRIIPADGAEIIGDHAFSDFENITYFFIPEGLKAFSSTALPANSAAPRALELESIEAWLGMEFSSAEESPLSNAIVLSLNGSDLLDIVIPEGVEEIGDYAFYHYNILKSVTIPSSVQSIGSYAFSNCRDFVTATIESDSVVIGSYAFANSRALTDITIKAGITSIDSNAFSGCSSLEEIEIPDGTERISDYSFMDCEKLVRISLSDDLKAIGQYAFANCGKLEEIDMPASLEAVGAYAFSGCSKLAEINMPTGLEIIGSHAFSGCGSLTRVDLQNAVSQIGESAFANCRSLATVTFSCQMESLPQKLFYNCCALESVILPNGLTTIEAYAFYNCNTLNGLVFPDGLTLIGSNAFEKCSRLYSLVMPASLERISEFAFRECTNLYELTLSDGAALTVERYAFASCSRLEKLSLCDNLVSIGSYAFNGCDNLSSINAESLAGWLTIAREDLSLYMPEGCELYIGGEILAGDVVIPEGISAIPKYAFQNCTKITSLTIPTSVESIMENAFKGCIRLKRVYASSWKHWTSIYYANYMSSPMYHANELYIDSELVGGELVFSGSTVSIPDYVYMNCDAITGITFTDDVETVIVGKSALRNCGSLTEVIFPDTLESATIMEGAFYGCDTLSYIYISDNVQNVERGAFYQCTNIQKARIPSDLVAGGVVTNIDNAGAMYSQGTFLYAFDSSVKEIVLSPNTTYIGQNAFANCTGITNMVLHEGITEIDARAFYNCSALEDLTLPESLSNIGISTFYGCERLTNVNVQNLDSWLRIRFGNPNASPMTLAQSLLIDGKEPYGEVVIPSDISIIGYSALRNCDQITSIVLPDTNLQVCEYAFEGCTGLQNVYASSLDKYLAMEYTDGKNTLMEYAQNLYVDGKPISGELVIPSTCTTLQPYAFKNCKDITSVVLHDELVTVMDSAFEGCSGIEKVKIESIEVLMNIQFDSEDANPLYYAKDLYIDDISIKNLDIPMDINEIKDYTFSGNCSLECILVHENIKSISDNAFTGREQLKVCIYEDTHAHNWFVTKELGFELEVLPFTISKGSCGNNVDWLLDKNGLLTISGSGAMASYPIAKLTPWADYSDTIRSIEIGSNVTSIGTFAFGECKNLEKISIPSSVIEIGNYAFQNCSSLTDFTVSRYVKKIGWSVFKGCSSLEKFAVEASSSYFKTIENVLYSADGKTLYAYPAALRMEIFTVPETVNSIYYGAFVCNNIGRIMIGSLVNSICTDSFDNSNAEICVHKNSYAHTWFSNMGKNVTLVPRVISSGTCGGNLKYQVLEDLESDTFYHLDISGSGTMYNYSSSSIPWRSYCTSIHSVSFSDGASSIGNYAFYNHTNLKKLEIGESITSIGQYAFYGCTSLGDFELNEGLKSIGNYAFWDCAALTGISLPDSLTSLGSNNFQFVSDNAFGQVDFGGGLQTIGNYCFNHCGQITDICFPESLQSIGSNSIQNNPMLNNVYIPNGVTTIGPGVFSGSSIKTASVGKAVLQKGITSVFSTSAPNNVTIIEGVTSLPSRSLSYKALYSVKLPSTLKEIGSYAFYDSTALDEVDLPEGLEVLGEYAFSGCRTLKSITIPASVKTIGDGAFYSCAMLEEAILLGEDCNLQALAFSNNQQLHILTIGGNIHSIADDTFSNCPQLKTLYVVDGVVSIPEKLLEKNAVIEKAIIPASVQSIGENSLYGCKNLTVLVNTGSAAEAYCNEYGIRCANLNDSITSLDMVVEFGACGESAAWAFVSDGRLCISGFGDIGEYSYSVLPPWKAYADKTTSIYVQEGIDKISSFAFHGSNATCISLPESVNWIGDNAFYGCSKLTSIDIPNKVENIFESTFSHCISLSEVHFPDGLKRVYQYAFYNTALTALKLPESLEVIDRYAFSELNIAELVIPESVTTIGDFAFYHNINLNKVTIAHTTTTIGINAFDLCSSNLVIKCHEDSAAAQYAKIKEIQTDIQAHTVRLIPGYSPDCTHSGLTDSSVCDVCEKILIEQETIPALGHDERIDEAVAVTCIESGLTEGLHCERCNEILIAQETIPALGHDECIDEAVVATCTEIGLTEGLHCERCNEILIAQEMIPALGHTKVIDEAIEPTCTETGMTEGEHCSVCNEVFIYQSSIPATGHVIRFEHAVQELQPGESAIVSYSIVCGHEANVKLLIPEELTIAGFVDDFPNITGNQACAATVIAETDDIFKSTANCRIVVHAAEQIVLPEALTMISDEAFANLTAEEVVLSDKVTHIGTRAFADSKALVLINLPDNVRIAKNAFAGCDKLTILCSEGSTGQTYAEANNIPYIVR